MKDSEGKPIGWSTNHVMVVRIPGMDCPQLIKLARKDRAVLHQKWRDLLVRSCGHRKLDPAWHSFGRFCYDMGPRPEGHHLARKEPKKGFSKSNCYWAPGDGRGGPRS